MSGIDPEKDKFPELRKTAAEKLLKKRKKTQRNNSIDLEREVQIHAIELEMQNEELQATQLKLVESIENYTELFDLAPIAYFILDRNGVILNVNLKGIQLFGIDKKEFIEKPLSIFFDGESRQDDYYRHHNRVIESNNQCRIESEIRKGDGTQVSVLIESSVVKDTKGNFKHILSTISDITEKKKQEELVFEAKARLEALIENSLSSIWSIDTDYRLTEWNTVHKVIFQKIYDISVYRGMSVLEHLNSKEQKEWKSYYDKAFSGTHFSVELKELHSEKEFYYEFSFNPICLRNKVVGVSVFVKDITIRKKAESELNYKVNELNTFMYKATHDLRSPLSSLAGLINVAKGISDVSELKSYFGMIDISVNRMDRLLIDLFNIVNITQGKLTICPINFETMIDEILESLKNWTGFSDVIIKKKISMDSLFFLSDSRLIYSVLQNIIDNSIKYRRDTSLVDTIIIIDISVNDKVAKIKITDNGSGIPTAFQEKVFDMFYRATNESTGTGLGLYIVKNTVEKLRGEIKLKSEEKHGTSISITLPNIIE